MILVVEQVTDSRRSIRSGGGKNNDGRWRGRRGARAGTINVGGYRSLRREREEKGDTKRAGRTKTRVERREGQALGLRLISPFPCLRRSPSIHVPSPFGAVQRSLCSSALGFVVAR